MLAPSLPLCYLTFTSVVFESSPKNISQANGTWFWIFLVLMVTLWMTALEKALSQFNIWKCMTLLTGSCHLVGALCLRSLMCKVPPHYSHTPQWSLSSWLAVARLLLCGHGLIFWFALSALHFFFSFWPGGMGSQKTVWRELSPSLSGRSPHPGSSYFSDVPTEPRHLYPIIPVLGDSLSPDKLEGPSTLLTVLGIELDSQRNIWSYPHTPGLLVTKTPLHTEGAGFLKSSTCMQSCPFWSHLPPSYQSARSFSQRGPSYKG